MHITRFGRRAVRLRASDWLVRCGGCAPRRPALVSRRVHRDDRVRAVIEGALQRDRRATKRRLIRVAIRVAIFTVLLSALYALAPLGERVSNFIVGELVVFLVLFLLLVAWEIREI